jgi:hypothetical protein
MREVRGPELVKKVPHFDGMQKFISAFTRSCHLSISCLRISTNYFHKICFNVILHLRQSLPNGLWSSDIPAKILLSISHLLCPTYLIRLHLICLLLICFGTWLAAE